MVLGIQIVGLLFGIFMIYYSFIHYKRKEFSIREFLIWLMMWFIFIYVAVFPHSLDFIVKKTLNLTRPLDFFIISGFMTIIALFFYTYTLVKINQKKLNYIVRKVAKKK